ncbi:MAG: hypothetical protein ACFB8W_15805 [Elainellaceae cyanobacterium]
MLQPNQSGADAEVLNGRSPVSLQFVTAEVPLQTSPTELRQAIESRLMAIGEPLRWAITGVDGDRQTAQVEAVVITFSDF